MPLQHDCVVDAALQLKQVLLEEEGAAQKKLAQSQVFPEYA